MNDDLEQILAEADDVAEKIRVLNLRFQLLMARYARSQERPPFDMEDLEW